MSKFIDHIQLENRSFRVSDDKREGAGFQKSSENNDVIHSCKDDFGSTGKFYLEKCPVIQ